MRRRLAGIAALCTVAAAGASTAESSGLQAPEQRDVRDSAYVLPRGLWAFDVSALGLGGGDAYAKLGLSYGLGAGVQLDMNLAHISVGLFNLAARWQFLETPDFSLGLAAAIWYGHGKWIWIVTREKAKEIISKLDVLRVPIRLQATVPLERFQFDVALQYTHGEVWGTVDDSDDFFLDAQFGIRQVAVRPDVRYFLTDRTELQAAADLPLYTAAPRERAALDGGRNETWDTVPFSKTWAVEAGVRSRFGSGVYGTLRLHYGALPRTLYGRALNPSFNLEFRF